MRLGTERRTVLRRALGFMSVHGVEQRDRNVYLP
jgi:hypothetical protein